MRTAILIATILCLAGTLNPAASTLESSAIGSDNRDEEPTLHAASPTVVYAMQEDLLRGLDVSNPASPVELFVRNRQDVDFFTQVIDLGGGAFYGRNPALASSWALFDGSDPANPQLVGALPVDLLAYASWVEGNSLFVVAELEGMGFGNHRFVEYSIVDPLNPALLAEHTFYGSFEFVVAVARHDDRVFVLGGDYQPDTVMHYVRHYDFSAWPAVPTQVEFVSLGGFDQTRSGALVEDPDGVVAASNGWALVRFRKANNGTWSTDTFAITNFGTAEVAGGFRDASGDLHLVGMRPDSGIDQVAIYSYANNGTLNFECSAVLPARPVGNHLLTPALLGGNYVLPLEDGSLRVGSHDCIGGYVQHADVPGAKLADIRACRLFAGHAYVGGPGKIDVYDLANPLDPTYLRTLDLTITVEEITPYDGSTLLAWDRTDELVVLNLADPANPAVVATHTLPVPAAAPGGIPPLMNASAPYVVIASSTASTSTICDLSVYEFSGFLSLTHHSTTTIPAVDTTETPHFLDLEVYGTAAYVAESMDTQTIDFSNPLLPTVAAVINDHGYRLSTTGGVLYVKRVNAPGGVGIYDLADPANPAPVGELDQSGDPVPVGHWLFLNKTSGLAAIYDASQPAAPALYDADASLPYWPTQASGDNRSLGGVYRATGSNWVPIYSLDALTAAPEPSTLSLAFAAQPNPSSRMVRFSWRAAVGRTYSLSIYDLRGRLVRSLASTAGPAGMRELVWQGRDAKGNSVASGSYFAVLDDGSGSSAQKILLVR